MLFHEFLASALTLWTTLVAGQQTSGQVRPPERPTSETPTPETPTPETPTSGPATTRPAAPAADPAAVSDEVPFAFPAQQAVNYRVTYSGEPTGTVRVQWRPVEGKPERLLEGTFDYSGRGRRLISSTETWLDPGLHPLRMKQTINSFASPGLAGGRQVSCTFTEGAATTLFSDLSKGQTQTKEHLIEGEVFVLERQAFEHWVVVAALLARRGSPSLQLFEPSGGEMLKIQFNRQAPADTDPPGTSRWYFHHTTFAASLWVTPDGQLVKYQQDDTEFVRVEP